jgi:hypothetical protein
MTDQWRERQLPAKTVSLQNAKACPAGTAKSALVVATTHVVSTEFLRVKVGKGTKTRQSSSDSGCRTKYKYTTKLWTTSNMHVFLFHSTLVLANRFRPRTAFRPQNHRESCHFLLRQWINGHLVLVERPHFYHDLFFFIFPLNDSRIDGRRLLSIFRCCERNKRRVRHGGKAHNTIDSSRKRRVSETVMHAV